jgi:hypothetical protein
LCASLKQFECIILYSCNISCFLGLFWLNWIVALSWYHLKSSKNTSRIGLNFFCIHHRFLCVCPGDVGINVIVWAILTFILSKLIEFWAYFTHPDKIGQKIGTYFNINTNWCQMSQNPSGHSWPLSQPGFIGYATVCLCVCDPHFIFILLNWIFLNRILPFWSCISAKPSSFLCCVYLSNVLSLCRW